jgi:cellulose synthase (UDP-forming)
MDFAEFASTGGPVAVLGMAIYLYSQRWLCHPLVERGPHWRGLSLKVACWPVFLLGTVLSVFRAEIPYIPTAKEARRGRFLALAWPHLLLLTSFAVTVGVTLYRRLALTPEGSLMLTSEAVWGMVGFASVSALMVFGGIRAAWEARGAPERKAWETVDVTRIGVDP